MLSIIKDNPYLTLLLATTLEGPIVTFISAGLAAHSLLRLEYVIIVTIAGDVLGDVILYLIGRYFPKLPLVRHITRKLSHKNKLHTSFYKRPLLYIIIGKFTPYLAIPTLVFAWLHHMSLVRFIIYSLIVSTGVKAIYIILWYLGAFSAQQIQIVLTGRIQLASYIIIWGIWLWAARHLYYHIGSLIKHNIKS